jgi:hypothetical protein
MSNPAASWGDSNASPSNKGNVSTGAATIGGLEYDPDIIFGANHITGWQNAAPDGSNSQTVLSSYFSSNPWLNYNPTWTANDATNIWGQVYTMGQLAIVAESLKGGSDVKTTRYDNNNAIASAINYEKAIRGNLLYIASQIDESSVEKKTVAYLYSIDDNETGYFFTPTANNMLIGNDTGAASTNSATNPNANYAANNGTIDYGFRATLPFITNTFDSGTPFSGGIIMAVEDINKANPTCTVSALASSALADVDIIIYNTTTLTSLVGTTDGKNYSGVSINADYQNPGFVSTWATNHGFSGTLIAGDDFATSINQGYGDVDTTSAGMSPMLYCQRNYTADKNAQAVWAFARVYPELYSNNPDATYGFWVNKIYHIDTANVPTIAAYMTNQSDNFNYNASVAAELEDYFELGYEWWTETGSYDPAWSQFAYYTGSSRASYYSGTAESEEPAATIGIFAPSYLWDSTPSSSRYAYSIGFDYGSKDSNDPHDYEGDSTPSAYYAATVYGMAGYSSYYSFYPTYEYLSGANPGGAGRLESDVIFLCGHASPISLAFGDVGGSPDNMCGVYYTGDQDNRSTSGYWYAGLQQQGRDLSGVKLISFFGCDTAGYSGDAASQSDNLCTRATDSSRDNGNYADAALGFTDSIYPFYGFSIDGWLFGDPLNASGPEWIKRYNDALVAGCTVNAAVDYANGINTFNDWGESAHIEGDGSITIVPL